MKAILVPAIALLILTAPTAAAANPPQSGTGGDCANDLITFFQTQGVPPPTSMVSVAPGTGYTLTSSSSGKYVDFFNSANVWVGWNAGAGSGTVPPAAAYGVVCPFQTSVSGIPVVLAPTATWTYQDGI